MTTSGISNIGGGAGQASEAAHVSRSGGAAFNAAAMRNASPADQRVAVAAQFEAILVRQMLGTTMNSVLGGAKGGVAGNVYGDMLTDTLSQQLTAGPGLGLSRFIQQQLTSDAGKMAPPTDGQSPDSSSSTVLSPPSALNSP